MRMHAKHEGELLPKGWQEAKEESKGNSRLDCQKASGRAGGVSCKCECACVVLRDKQAQGGACRDESDQTRKSTGIDEKTRKSTGRDRRSGSSELSLQWLSCHDLNGSLLQPQCLIGNDVNASFLQPSNQVQHLGISVESLRWESLDAYILG
jgi:hypothetical protein